MTVALVLGALLAAAAAVFVGLPFVREPETRDDVLRHPRLDARTLELIEERDRALAALKELEFDHRAGKLSDGDYRDLVGGYRRSAAAALRALDAR